MTKQITSRLIAGCILAFAIATVVGVELSRARHNLANRPVQKTARADNSLVVHEWGTFTSIAGKDGLALEWRPLNGSSDLPKFVHTMQEGGGGLRNIPSKASMVAQERMETPVLYFYSPDEMDVSAKVDFPKGKITEWYPQARNVSAGIDWGKFKVMPGAALTFPVENAESHYYPARETDAAPLQVCGTLGKPAQAEKFLFYRGVGTFDLPLSVRLEGESIILKNLGKDKIAHLVIFENRGGKIGYRLYDQFTGEMTDVRPALDKNIDSLLSDLKQILVSSGLYEKEAEAMIKTWRGDWFNEGTRVFYILPRSVTDAILPLTIDPRPTEIVRVLVGRAEVITPEMEKRVQGQISLLKDPSPEVRETAMREIRKYGRFSEPILKRLLETENDPQTRARIKALIENHGA
ncbi:MAG: hypothetical protein M3362_07125 [Acidobacteriota bacterium]|nr:hypothetical protein [Acidobacteriota bacterium]